MRTIAVLATLVAASWGTKGRAEDKVRAAYRADLTATIGQHVDGHLNEWLSFYHDLHSHPELSLEESESAGKIAERLAAAGYAVTSNVGKTGVVGVLDNGPGPTILIRGDMDALPVVEETGLPYASQVHATRADGHDVGVMHACGHDIHQTCLVGTAATLARLRDHWSGRLMIVAQPAEEIGAGARMMIEDGLFTRFGQAD